MAKKWRMQTSEIGDMKDDEYAEYFICDNCDEKIYVFIKMGIKIKDVRPKVKCERCGVLQK